MEQKINWLFAIVFGSFLLLYGGRGEAAGAGRYLVVAKPAGVKFLRHSDDVGAAASPGYYRLRVKDARVIQGRDEDLPKNMSVEIRANNGDAIIGYDQVYLLIDVSGNGNISVIFWERVMATACLPPSLVDQRYSDRYFDDTIGGQKMKCVYLRGYDQGPVP